MEEIAGTPYEILPEACKDSFHTKFYPAYPTDCISLHLHSRPNPMLICLGCGISRSLVPEGGYEEPLWLGMYENKRKLNFITATMEKRRKKQVCILCGEDVVRKVGGLKFCEPHAEAAERQGV